MSQDEDWMALPEAKLMRAQVRDALRRVTPVVVRAIAAEHAAFTLPECAAARGITDTRWRTTAGMELYEILWLEILARWLWAVQGEMGGGGTCELMSALHVAKQLGVVQGIVRDIGDKFERDTSLPDSLCWPTDEPTP